MDPPATTITPEAFDDPVAERLVREAESELLRRYGPGVEEPSAASEAEPPLRPLRPGDFMPPVGVFLVARVGDEAVGCVGIRPQLGETAEVKRLYVRTSHRGGGLARRLMTAVEAWARELEYTRLVLETGDAQPEAVALYDSSGWTRTRVYFGAIPHVRSIYFRKDLGSAG